MLPQIDTSAASKPGLSAIMPARSTWDFKGLVLAEGPETLFPVFMSVLELVRTGQVDVEQPTRGAILVKLRLDRDESRRRSERTTSLHAWREVTLDE